jgi:thiol:disulfide interchange protein
MFSNEVTGSFNFLDKETLTEVIEVAELQNKPVFMEFYTDWCLPCKIMDEEVFTNHELGRFFNDSFVSYKVDAESTNGNNLAFLYRVKVYPTLIFVDHKGRELLRENGSVSVAELKELGIRARQLYDKISMP